MENNNQIGLDILSFKIVFNLIINMKMFFYFVPTIFKNHMFKVYLNRFIEIHENVKFYKSTCKQMKYTIFFTFKLMET
jgi:hypothetical protein